MLPKHFFNKKCTLKTPPTHQKIKLDQFQKNHLVIKDSIIHNRGVFLRPEEKTIKKRQVVGIYHGCLIRIRPLTIDECISTGEVASKDIGSTTHPNIWMTWRSDGRQSHIRQKLPFYHALIPNYFYQSQHGEINFGIDALNSKYPLANMNCSEKHESPNIFLIPCIDNAWIESISDQRVKVNPAIPEGAICILAVASKTILPNTELTTVYNETISEEETTVQSSFHVGDQYFHLKFSKAPIISKYSKQGAELFIRSSRHMQSPSHSTHSETVEYIKELIDKKTTMDIIVSTLNGEKQNPLTGNHHWDSGDVQYLCDLKGIPVPGEKYANLNYIFHCTDGHQILDNQGRNYLFGFIRQHLFNIFFESLKEPETLDEVPPFIEKYLEEFSAISSALESLDIAMRSHEKRSVALTTAQAELKKFTMRLGVKAREGLADNTPLPLPATRRLTSMATSSEKMEIHTENSSNAESMHEMSMLLRSNRKRSRTHRTHDISDTLYPFRKNVALPENEVLSTKSCEQISVTKKSRAAPISIEKARRKARTYNPVQPVPEALKKLQHSEDCPAWLKGVNLDIKPLFSGIKSFLKYTWEQNMSSASKEYFEVLSTAKTTPSKIKETLKGNDQEKIKAILFFKLSYVSTQLEDHEYKKLFSMVYSYLGSFPEVMRSSDVKNHFIKTPLEIFSSDTLTGIHNFKSLAEFTHDSSEQIRNNSRYLIVRLYDNKNPQDVAREFKRLMVTPPYGTDWGEHHVQSMRGELVASMADDLMAQITSSSHTVAQTRRLFALIEQGYKKGLAQYIEWRKSPTKFRKADSDEQIAERLNGYLTIPGTNNTQWGGKDVRDVMKKIKSTPRKRTRPEDFQLQERHHPPLKRPKKTADRDPLPCSRQKRIFAADSVQNIQVCNLRAAQSDLDWLKGVNLEPHPLFTTLKEVVAYIKTHANHHVITHLNSFPKSFNKKNLCHYFSNADKDEIDAYLIKLMENFVTSSRKDPPTQLFSQVSAQANTSLKTVLKKPLDADSLRSRFLNSIEELFSISLLLHRKASLLANAAKNTTLEKTDRNNACYMMVRLFDNKNSHKVAAHINRLNVPPIYYGPQNIWRATHVQSIRGDLLPCHWEEIFQALVKEPGTRSHWEKFYALANMACKNIIIEFVKWRRGTIIPPESNEIIAKRLKGKILIPGHNNNTNWTASTIEALVPSAVSTN